MASIAIGTGLGAKAELMKERIKSVGNYLLGAVMLVVVFGVMGVCQYGYGQVRPYMPWPITSLIGGENETMVREYFYDIERALERFVEASDECAKTTDQPCLTNVVRDLRNAIGPSIPASASWMSDSHQRLYESFSVMLDLNERAETGERSPEMALEVLDASIEVGDAVQAWIESANR